MRYLKLFHSEGFEPTTSQYVWRHHSNYLIAAVVALGMGVVAALSLDDRVVSRVLKGTKANLILTQDTPEHFRHLLLSYLSNNSFSNTL